MFKISEGEQSRLGPPERGIGVDHAMCSSVHTTQYYAVQSRYPRRSHDAWVFFTSSHQNQTTMYAATYNVSGYQRVKLPGLL